MPGWPKSLFPIAWSNLSKNCELALALWLQDIAYTHWFRIDSGSRLEGIVVSHNHGILPLWGNLRKLGGDPLLHFRHLLLGKVLMRKEVESPVLVIFAEG